ncbi:MAG: NADH-quinone oxidoreductase subunit C [Vulcanimicrobiaceae bacterium]
MPSPQAPPLGSRVLDPTAVRPAIDDAIVERVEARALRARLETLRAEGFAALLDIGGVDYLDRKPRFDVVYHLLKLPVRAATVAAIGTPERIRILCGLDAGVALPTVSDIWPSADWAEREVYDLFGIRFDGHPDLRRIQMPIDWEGHPLRKDYPLRGPGLEKTPRPDFALKSNVPAGTPPSGKTAAALAKQIAKIRGQSE